MARESPKNVSASVRARLLQRSRDKRIDFQILLTRYALDRLLYRLSRSEHRNRFVLKGAMLLISETFELERAPLARAVRQTFARRETALPQESQSASVKPMLKPGVVNGEPSWPASGWPRCPSKWPRWSPTWSDSCCR